MLGEVITSILSGEIDHGAVSEVTHDVGGKGHSDTKGVVACLHFVLSNGAKYDVDEKTLLLEIQQLGLPQEVADAIGRKYNDEKEAIRARFEQQAYSLNRLKGVEWRVDEVIATGKKNSPRSQEERTGAGGGKAHARCRGICAKAEAKYATRLVRV